MATNLAAAVWAGLHRPVVVAAAKYLTLTMALALTVAWPYIGGVRVIDDIDLSLFDGERFELTGSMQLFQDFSGREGNANFGFTPKSVHAIFECDAMFADHRCSARPTDACPAESNCDVVGGKCKYDPHCPRSGRITGETTEEGVCANNRRRCVMGFGPDGVPGCRSRPEAHDLSDLKPWCETAKVTSGTIAIFSLLSLSQLSWLVGRVPGMAAAMAGKRWHVLMTVVFFGLVTAWMASIAHMHDELPGVTYTDGGVAMGLIAFVFSISALSLLHTVIVFVIQGKEYVPAGGTEHHMGGSYAYAGAM